MNNSENNACTICQMCYSLVIGSANTQGNIMAKLPNYVVKSQTFRDDKNILKSRSVVIIGDKAYLPSYVGSVWRDKVWSGGKVGYTREEGVIIIGGVQYRVCDKVAKPLVLAEGETVEPLEFMAGKCVVWK